jgi:hypothetical protein
MQQHGSSASMPLMRTQQTVITTAYQAKQAALAAALSHEAAQQAVEQLRDEGAAWRAQAALLEAAVADAARQSAAQRAASEEAVAAAAAEAAAARRSAETARAAAKAAAR